MNLHSPYGQCLKENILFYMTYSLNMIMKIYVTIYTYIEQSAPGRWNGRVLQKHLDRSIHVGLTAPTGLVVGPDNKVVLFSSYIDSSGFTTKIHSLQSWEEGWVVEKVAASSISHTSQHQHSQLLGLQ